MKYIILAAGVGSRLHPLTLNCPKCLFKLDKNYTIIQKMIDSINKYDTAAQIITVIGFMASEIKKKTTGTEFVYNPFYSITNSISSLWFAREYLYDKVTIINGDIVMEDALIANVVTTPADYPCVLLDSSIKNGDYNAQVYNEDVLVMGKELQDYYGEYAGVTKLDKNTANLLKNEIDKMVEDGHINRWYEDALVQLIFNQSINLKYKDVSDHEWTEVDCVDDLFKAKSIYQKNL